MELWRELRRTIAALDSASPAGDIVAECLRGIEILEVLGGKEGAFARFLRQPPRPGDEHDAVNRWLVELDKAIGEALRGGRALVLKTMHLTHGLRESFPFDDTTTLQHVEQYLLKSYRDSIHEYITKSTSELLPDGPIRLDFYDGNPREGVEPRPLNPETKVATLPSAETDGVYWWPQSKEPLKEPETYGTLSAGDIRVSFGDLQTARDIAATLRWTPEQILSADVNRHYYRDTISILRAFDNSHFLDLKLRTREVPKADVRAALSKEVERAFRIVIFRAALVRAPGGPAPSTAELLERISFQIVGTAPHQMLVIQCDEEAAAVKLPERIDFHEAHLMATAAAERDKVSAQDGKSTDYFEGRGGHGGGRSSRRSNRSPKRR